MTISHCLTLLLDELREAGLADPLVERFTLAATWDDLCRLAGEETPESVRAALGDGLAAPGSADLASDPPMAVPSSRDPTHDPRRADRATSRGAGKAV